MKAGVLENITKSNNAHKHSVHVDGMFFAREEI